MKSKIKDKLVAMVALMPFIIWGISITLIILAVPVAYWPHYERAVYEQAEVPENVVEKEIKSLADLQDIYEEEQQLNEDYWDNYSIYFSFEVEKENLEPLGFYMNEYQFSEPSSGSGTSSSKYRLKNSGPIVSNSTSVPEYTWNALNAFFYRKNAIYAQMYSLKLEDGTKILILLGDTAMKLSGKGTVKIPAATWEWLFLLTYRDAQTGEALEGRTGDQHVALLAKKAQAGKTEEGNIFYIDATDWWMNYNDDLIEACDRRTELNAAMFVIGLCGIFVGLIALFVCNFRTTKTDDLT